MKQSSIEKLIMMLFEDIEPVITPDLEAAINAAYGTFAIYHLNGNFTYCDCPVCMSNEVARQLSSLPLKDITAALLAEYTNSAHAYDEITVEPEFKHFLPRYLELIALCDPPSHLGLETSLTRLEGYRNRWPDAEIKAIDEFFESFLKASLNQLKLIEWPVGLRLEFDIGDVLVMIVRAGGDLDRALEIFEKTPDIKPALHMAALRENLRLRGGQPYFDHAHLAEYNDAAMKIGAFLNRKEVSEKILNAAEKIDNPDYDDVLEQGLWEL